MAKTRQPKRTDALTVAKKIQHVQDLWDAIAAEADDVELTPAQRKELERRIRAHDAAPEAASPWHKVRRRIRSKR
jgi:putative addiction module component (TIGR02574 family)